MLSDAACTIIPLAMPYNIHQYQSKNAKKNVFDYVLWSMDQPMSKEDDAIKYYR
jgi:hypothetical protein